MDEQKQYDQQEPIYNSSVRIQDVALKTYRERWTMEMGGKRESERSMLVAWQDNDEWYTKLLKQIWQVTLGEYQVSPVPSVIHLLHYLDKILQRCWIVPHVNKIL